MKRIVVAFLLLVLPLSGGCLGGVPLDRYCYVLDLGVFLWFCQPLISVGAPSNDNAAAGPRKRPAPRMGDAVARLSTAPCPA